MKYNFPFGEELKRVVQKDRSPKSTFVLGVYASAVHARWVDQNGKEKVKALAVASEPEIFWRGENAEDIISKIKIPEQLGKLTTPTNRSFNGPSGITLDEKYLKPLNLSRNKVWLCDLLPESRVNKSQRKAISKYYTDEIIAKYNLPITNIPDFNKSELGSKERIQEILLELEESKAETIIILGDLPLKHFLFHFDKKFNSLSELIGNSNKYGGKYDISINGKHYKVIPLCHPRQAGRLGKSNNKWGSMHDEWIKQHQL